jgi:hypothetical protein
MALSLNVARVVAGILVVSQVVLAFLLSQGDVEFQPLVRVMLGAASAGVTALAAFLRIEPPTAR